MTLVGNTVNTFGQVNTNGGNSTSSTEPTSDIADIILNDPFLDPFLNPFSDPFLDSAIVGFSAFLIEQVPDIPVGPVFNALSPSERGEFVSQLEETFDIPSGPGDTNLDFFEEFPDDTLEEIIDKIADKEDAIQSTVLSDFLENGSETSGC